MMREETETEREHKLRLQDDLRAHRYRITNWESIKNSSAASRWIPQGLTCPGCGADFCEIDGHSC